MCTSGCLSWTHTEDQIFVDRFGGRRNSLLLTEMLEVLILKLRQR